MTSTSSGDPECAVVVIDRVPDSATSGDLVLPLFEGRAAYLTIPSDPMRDADADLCAAGHWSGQPRPGRGCLVPRRKAAATPDTTAGPQRVLVSHGCGLGIGSPRPLTRYPAAAGR